jgi:hypothetical protein
MKHRIMFLFCGIAIAGTLLAAAAWAEETGPAAEKQQKPESQTQPVPVAPQMPSGIYQIAPAPLQPPPAGPMQAIPVVPQMPSNTSQMIPAPQQPAPQYYYAPQPQQYYVPAAPQYYGQWAWDPTAGAWVWQIIVVPPPTYYYWPPYPYWPPGRYTFTPNPDYRNTITGMMFAPPPQAPMTFKPGEGAQFPWLPQKPAEEQKPSTPTRSEKRLPAPEK